MSEEPTVKAALPHLSSIETYRMVNQRLGVAEITDQAAATIASWWQSSGRNGLAFAALAGGHEVKQEALLDAIHIERRMVGNTDWDNQALDMLATWAINKSKEENR